MIVSTLESVKSVLAGFVERLGCCSAHVIDRE